MMQRKLTGWTGVKCVQLASSAHGDTALHPVNFEHVNRSTAVLGGMLAAWNREIMSRMSVSAVLCAPCLPCAEVTCNAKRT